MELASRKGADIYVPTGEFGRRSALLRATPGLADVPVAVVACNDRRTRMLPFSIYDNYIFPAGPRVVAATLFEAGFTQTRAVFQRWNPNFSPSKTRVGGKPLEVLLLSSLAISSYESYRLIRDAWSLGDARPLIIVGGPKAIYEPYHFFPIPTDEQSRLPSKIGADVACTGEAFVLLDLFNIITQYRGAGDTMRTAFERARKDGALEAAPGLVYLEPSASYEKPAVVDTGLQRLVKSFDELPEEAVALGLIEPPSRGTGLAEKPLAADKVHRHLRILSVQMTQGCKFTCSYCPIPAVNQKTWRHRSPGYLAQQLADCYDRYRIKVAFGTDDNFFNRRETAEEMLTALAEVKTERGKQLGDRVRWGTEATQFDTYKNRDLLPLARRAGLSAIWFGIEDLTAELVNKGQKPEVTLALFKLLHGHKIAPMAMMMYHDGQPFQTPRSLYGLSNQIRFLRDAGAVSLQCTVHTPAVGTREFENTYDSGKVVDKLGNFRLSERHTDGNHVIVEGKEPSWLRQVKWIAGYATFYNPLNIFRALKADTPLRTERALMQVAGTVATIHTAIKTFPYLLRLIFTKTSYHPETPAIEPIPVRVPDGAFARMPIERERQHAA